MAISRCEKILKNLVKYMGVSFNNHPLSVLENRVMSFAGASEKELGTLAFYIKSVIEADKKYLGNAVSNFNMQLFDCKSYFSN